MGSSTKEMTSAVSSMRRIAVGPYGCGRVDVGLLVEPCLFGDQLGREEPVDLVPGGTDLRSHGLAEYLTHRAEQVAPDDGVLLRPDAQEMCL